MSRTVLLDSFGAIMRLGLQAVLREAHCHVLDQDCVGSIDAVLFDMDQPACTAAALRLKAMHPRARVIACSTRHPVMRVFDHGHPGSDHPLTVASLCAALAATPRTTPGL